VHHSLLKLHDAGELHRICQNGGRIAGLTGQEKQFLRIHRGALRVDRRIEINSIRSMRKRGIMLWTIAVILLVLWVLGMVTFHALGMYVHILLVLAIIAVLIRVIQGRNPL